MTIRRRAHLLQAAEPGADERRDATKPLMAADGALCEDCDPAHVSGSARSHAHAP
jgi:hypothetical protein